MVIWRRIQEPSPLANIRGMTATTIMYKIAGWILANTAVCVCVVPLATL